MNIFISFSESNQTIKIIKIIKIIIEFLVGIVDCDRMSDFAGLSLHLLSDSTTETSQITIHTHTDTRIHTCAIPLSLIFLTKHSILFYYV